MSGTRDYAATAPPQQTHETGDPLTMSDADEVLAGLERDPAISRGTGLVVTGDDARRAVALLGEAYRAAVLFQAERDQLRVTLAAAVADRPAGADDGGVGDVDAEARGFIDAAIRSAPADAAGPPHMIVAAEGVRLTRALADARAEHRSFVTGAGSQLAELVLRLDSANEVLKAIALVGAKGTAEQRLLADVARDALTPPPAQPDSELPAVEVTELAKLLGVGEHVVQFVAGHYLGHLIKQGLVASDVLGAVVEYLEARAGGEGTVALGEQGSAPAGHPVPAPATDTGAYRAAAGASLYERIVAADNELEGDGR
jgi:hypothetical protein